MSPYRPLFHELGDDLFAIAKGILEVAVTPAPPAPRPPKLSRVGLMIANLEGGPALKYALLRLMGTRMLVYRLPMKVAIAAKVERSCGHIGVVHVDERIVELAPHGEVYDAFLGAVERAGPAVLLHARGDAVNPYRTDGYDDPPHDPTAYPEENILAVALSRMIKHGVRLKRVVMNAQEFWYMARRLTPAVARARFGRVELITAVGTVRVVPGDVPQNSLRYE